ncbi:dynein regulatory complex protein 12 isoform X4 [Erythrolamprus reginae]|uniref:dynein regulatory complex protein 12 isoform X4 n=1 Tax=Erythrolamprus reginae TaxID=121349 RepID=UPI00396CA008
MPLPKRRKVKKTKKEKSPTLGEERHQKASPESDALKQHLVLQRDLAKQATIDREGFRQRLTELERRLEEAQKDKKDIYEAACQKTLQRSEEDRAKISAEKDQAVAQMQQKAEEMEKECRRILHETLDQVLSKLQATKLGWNTEATLIHSEYKDVLKEFGLNPLEI